MTHAGEHHGHAVLIGGHDDLRIADGSAGLDHGFDTVFGGDVDPVAKWEVGIRGHHRAGHGEVLVVRLHGGDAGGIDAAHLPRADAHGGSLPHEHDGVRLDE